MADTVNVALDAMGGDNAPDEMIRGAIDAVNKAPDIHVCLVGQEEKINAFLSSCSYNREQISVVNATEVIETGEHPVNAIRKKKDLSLIHI